MKTEIYKCVKNSEDKGLEVGLSWRVKKRSYSAIRGMLFTLESASKELNNLDMGVVHKYFVKR